MSGMPVSSFKHDKQVFMRYPTPNGDDMLKWLPKKIPELSDGLPVAVYDILDLRERIEFLDSTTNRWLPELKNENAKNIFISCLKTAFLVTLIAGTMLKSGGGKHCFGSNCDRYKPCFL